MSGYLSFAYTGNPLIDAILSAVEDAGTAYHHTSQWADEGYDGEPSCVEAIEKAAKEAATALAAQAVPAADAVADIDLVRRIIASLERDAENSRGGLAYLQTAANIIRNLLAALPASAPAAPVSEAGDKYAELILAVGNKYPGETRHETALRYIRQAESSNSDAAKGQEPSNAE